MLAKQVYHTATPYIISRQRYIIENNNKLWYNQLDKLEFADVKNIIRFFCNDKVEQRFPKAISVRYRVAVV